MVIQCHAGGFFVVKIFVPFCLRMKNKQPYYFG